MFKIDLYSDPTYPWCIIGAHRLGKVLRERFPNLVVDIEHIYAGWSHQMNGIKRRRTRRAYSS